MAALRELQLLTAKPFLYVFNMDVSELADEDLRKRLTGLVAPAEAIFLDAKTEADLAELSEDEAAELLAEAGLGEPGLAVVRGDQVVGGEHAIQVVTRRRGRGGAPPRPWARACPG